MNNTKPIDNRIVGNTEVEENTSGKIIKGVIHKRAYYNNRTKEQIIKVVTKDEYEEIAEEERQIKENRKNYKEKYRKGGMNGNWMKRIYGK